MATQKALVLKSKVEPLSLRTVPIPAVGPGSVVVRVLGTFILSYLPSILDGSLPYSMTLPLIPGGSSIGRVESVGPDAVSLKPGQLVYCDITIRARDNPNLAILMGLHGEAAMRLMEGEWRNSTFAQYTKFPLENVFALDEDILCDKLGYSTDDLCAISSKSASTVCTLLKAELMNFFQVVLYLSADSRILIFFPEKP